MQINRTMAIVCLVSSCVLVGAQEIRRDGRWEVTMQMDMPNMPMKMPPIKTVQCVTKEQVDDPNQLPKGAQEKNKDCKVSDYKVTGNTPYKGHKPAEEFEADLTEEEERRAKDRGSIHVVRRNDKTEQSKEEA